jgi:hypothetical protein
MAATLQWVPAAPRWAGRYAMFQYFHQKYPQRQLLYLILRHQQVNI